MRLLLALLLTGSSAFAAKRATLHGHIDGEMHGRDKLVFLGWNNACSVAIQYFSYPKLGESILGTPDKWKVGTVSIGPGADKEEHEWIYTHTKSEYWDPNRSRMDSQSLIQEGYDIPGFVERLRKAPVADHPELFHVLHTTLPFNTGGRVSWPEERFILAEVRYSPYGHCAFITYRDETKPRASYDFRLIRMLEPGVRRRRARAHTTNGILLYKENTDIYAAEQELAIATQMDPKYSLALYYHGAFLIQHGSYDEGLNRLKAAVKISPRFIEKAIAAKEFETVRDHPEFKRIIRKKDPWIHPVREAPKNYH